MPVGSARPGAGRPKGARNKKTVEAVKAIEASGLMPLEYMLSVLRDTQAPADKRLDAASKAAPYCHAKLSSVEMTGKDGGPVEVTRIERVIVRS